MLDISTERNLDRLAFTRKFVDTVASVFDKEVVDFFEGEVAGFWVAVEIVSNAGKGEKKRGGERRKRSKGRKKGAGNVPEINQRYEGEIGAHEDEVGLPLEVVEQGWCDHDNDKILYCCQSDRFRSVSVYVQDSPRASLRRYRSLCPLLWREEAEFLAHIPCYALIFCRHLWCSK